MKIIEKCKSNLSLFLLIIFLFYPYLNIWSQSIKSPGGTSLNTELWISSSDIVASSSINDLSDVSVWNDRSSNGYNFVKNSTNLVPNINFSENFNFEPAVSFYASSTNSEGDPTVGPNDISRKLVSSKTFSLLATKSYYTFWVSSLTSSYYSGVSYPTVFSFGNYATGAINSVGWYAYNPTAGDRLRINSTTRGIQNAITTTTALNNYYNGIGSSIVPNTTSSIQSIYFNGSLISSPRARTMFTGRYSPTPAILGNSNITTANPFYGDVYEVIVLSSTAGTSISTVDLSKVHSYLAVKYGVTLPGDYVSSNGITFWSASKNTGYTTEVFGIGCDTASGLLKKQSKSQSNNKLIMFVGNTLSTLNEKNNSTYFTNKDKTFLMLGKNNIDGNVPYKYAAGQVFQLGTLTTDINERSGGVYKAQITGASSMTVNFSVGAKYILVSTNDPNFSPAKTRTYEVVNGVAKDVVINDGDLLSLGLYTYAPGGVAEGLKVWLRADHLSSLELINTDDVSVWKDQTSNANDYSYQDVVLAAKTHPKYVPVASDMNFYPTVKFDIDSYLAIANGPMSQDAPLDFTSFVAYYSTAYADNVRLYTHGFGSANPRTAVNRRPAMGFAPGEGVGRIRNSGGSTGQSNIDGSIAGYKMGTAALQMINTHKANGVSGAGYAIHDFGGWQEKVTATGLTGDGFRMASGGVIGGASLTSGSFQGYMPELFFYERALNMDEQDKLRTYLGIKYAITLDADGSSPTVNYDYKLSDGTIVWAGNSLPNQRFHNNVAGIVRDDASDLFNNKVRSSSNGATITMSIAGHKEEGQGTVSEISDDMDLSGLFLGHNGITTTVDLTNNTTACGEYDFRTGRVWLVDKTKLSDLTVDLKIDNSNYFTWASSQYDVFLLVASSLDDFENNKWDRTIPTTFDGTSHVIRYKFTNKYTYFALGVKEKAGTCASCTFDGIKKLEFNTSNWTNGTQSGTFNLGDGFVATLNTTIESPASFYSNSYPRAYTSNTLNELRRGSTSSKMTTNISLSTAAAASFEIYEIDRLSTRYDNVRVYGYCGNTLIYPQLSYGVTDYAKRSYTIFTDYRAVAKRSPSVSYTNPGGVMYVDFDVPVDRIVVEHIATGAITGSSRIGLGSIEFLCPPPLPPVNEDGLVITKQGPSSVLLCEDITYTFRIYNSNCSAVSVNFSDILPTGMKWLENSLSVDTIAIGSNTLIKEYGGTNMLAVNSLIVPGAKTLLFRAKARFESTATAKTYSNQSNIKYTITENGISVSKSLFSCDRMNASVGCLTTKTIATQATNSPAKLIVNDVVISKSCYREKDALKVTITINNPNNYSLMNASLGVVFNDEFNYQANSLSSSTITNLINVVLDNGYIAAEGFTIPSGNNTISFSILAPSTKNGLVLFIDENGKPILDDDGKQLYSPLDIRWNMYGINAERCNNETFSETNGEFTIPYCSSKTYVISNKHVTGKIKK